MKSSSAALQGLGPGSVFLIAALCIAAPALGRDAGVDGADDARSVGAASSAAPLGRAGGADAGNDADAATDDPRISQLRELLEGTLDVRVEPQALFNVALDDQSAVHIEAVRIQALLTTVEQIKRRGAATRVRARPPADAAAPDASLQEQIEALDPQEWQGQLALDRMRLEFYSLPQARRAELLQLHEDRREAARPRETDEQRRAREAEAERQRALEAARVARSEAERAVSEELARIIGVQRTVASARERIRAAREGLVARRDVVLGWQRRVRDAKAGPANDADTLYGALRRTLVGSRDELERALDDINAGVSEVPELGPDPLVNIPSDVPTDQVRARRDLVDQEGREARAEEKALREDRASMLLAEMNALNRERLGLLSNLTADKRGAITGFTTPGWDQARSEGRHLVLVLRYHQHIAARWIHSLRAGGLAGVSPWKAAALAVPWLLLTAVFAWWRRRSPGLLASAESRLAEADRIGRRTSPGPSRQALRFLGGVYRPVEWLTYFGATIWLLPASASGLVEVQLLTSVVGWSLGGALIVNVINALAAGSASTLSSPNEEGGALRLRSLRLVGRVAVAFILTLVVSGRLVGKGTVYSWVLSTCWVAAIPIFLVLVRWWRATVFEHVERVRRKTTFQSWVLANRRGWKSFIPAMLGAVHLFTLGAIKTVRNWFGSFHLARRAHAYLFKRELDRLAGSKAPAETIPLRASAFAALSPDAADELWISCPADEPLAQLRARAQAKRGGLVAIVGARGLGKSLILRKLGAQVPDAVAMSCVANDSVDAIRSTLGQNAEQPHCRDSIPTGLILLDDAQAVVKPVLGGLGVFDAVLQYARAHSQGTLWVLAIDAALWPFLQRARDARPLFDEVILLEDWTEEQISDLLCRRSEAAGITPVFEDLLDRLPPSADEIDKQDALSAKRTGYYRMIWDHARGNPGVVLEVWRSSLVEDPDSTVRVRGLQVEESAKLDTLPDGALFVLRAVLQLSPATVADVAKATRMTEGQVQDVFLFGQAHGFLEGHGSGVRVAWRWLRSVTRLLERRHLLVNT